jgi:HKD family nuclease
MQTENKLKSRKLWITILVIVIVSILKFLDKMQDFYFIISILVSSGVYLFVEGSIDVSNIKIKTGVIDIEQNKLNENQGKEN